MGTSATRTATSSDGFRTQLLSLCASSFASAESPADQLTAAAEALYEVLPCSRWIVRQRKDGVYIEERFAGFEVGCFFATIGAEQALALAMLVAEADDDQIDDLVKEAA